MNPPSANSVEDDDVIFISDSNHQIVETSKPLTEDEKIEVLMESVVKQGKIGKMVIIVDHFENPYKSLQKAVVLADLDMVVLKQEVLMDNPERAVYVIKIDGEELARGTYTSMQNAKRNLARAAIDRLVYTCFVMYKKIVKASVSSKTHALLMDIEWINRGVFSEIQQNFEKVLVCEHFTKPNGPPLEMLDIPKIIDNFISSPEYLVLILHVDLNFSGLLMVALRCNELRLKLTTSDHSHKILIICKRLTRIDVVKELLKNGGHDEMYDLHIPKLFKL